MPPFTSKYEVDLGRCTGIAVLAAMLIGCNRNTGKFGISGEVTLDQAPLDGGSIQFSSLGQLKASSGAMVQNGQYDIPAEKGLPPGTYRVVITAPDLNAPPVMVRDNPGEPGMPVPPDLIPAEYNVKSQQTIEVSRDGDNQFDFHIVSRAAR